MVKGQEKEVKMEVKIHLEKKKYILKDDEECRKASTI